MFLGNKWKNQSPLLRREEKQVEELQSLPCPQHLLLIFFSPGDGGDSPRSLQEACDSFWGGKDSVTPGNKIYEAKKKKKKKSTKAVNSSPPVYAQIDPSCQMKQHEEARNWHKQSQNIFDTNIPQSTVICKYDTS